VEIRRLRVGLAGHWQDVGWDASPAGKGDDRGAAIATEFGVVQNSPFLGYTGERKPPAFEARFRLRSWPVREAVSLPRSSALRLNGSEAQQRQPMRMALAGHQFSWAFAGALGNPAAHEAAMVQEEL
jgi:hypothetical protein